MRTRSRIPRSEFSTFGRNFSLGALATTRRRVTPFQLAVLSLEDNRLFNPAGPFAAPQSFRRSARRLVVAPTFSTSGSVPVGIAFSGPRQVARCVRRKVRREVILARGKGGGRHRPPRRNYWSDVEC